MRECVAVHDKGVCVDDLAERLRYLGRKGLHGWPDTLVVSPNKTKREATVSLSVLGTS